MKIIMRYLFLAFMLIQVTNRSWAKDVGTVDELRSAIASGESNIRLMAPIELGDNTLTISSGKLILDLNGKELSATRISDGKGVCVRVNGSADVTITGGGKITATSKGTYEGSWWRVYGYDAIGIAYDGGSVAVRDVTIATFPSAGKNGNGESYTLDPNKDDGITRTVASMVPYGTYMEQSSDYESEGLKVSPLKVSLVEYTISYTPEVGTIEMISPYTLETYAKPKGIRKGYTFVELTPKTSGVIYVNNVPVLKDRTSHNTIEFEAKWEPIKYKIEYKDKDSDEQLATGTYTIEEEITSFASYPTREDAIFNGWYIDKQCSQKVTLIEVGSTGDKTFYGQWLTKHTITYDCGDKDVKLPDDAVKEFHKKTATFNLPSNLTRIGYNFKGWKKEGDTSDKIYTKVETNTDESLSLVACWSPKEYQANFYVEDGNTTPFEQKNYTIESKATFPTIEGKKEHYEFTGDWKYNGSLVQALPYPEDEKTPVNLYAVWKPVPYHISFNVQASDVSTPSDIEYNIETNGTSLPKNLKRTGYAFIDWYKDKDLAQTFGTIIPKGTNGNFTLYAKWEPIKYTITYNTYSDVDVPSSTYTIEKEVALPAPQRSAYSFAGWYESDRLEGKSIMAIAEGTIGNKTLYAKWSAGSVVTISQGANGTFTVKNGDKEIKSGEYVGPKTELTLTATPVAPYTLSKWVVNGKDVIGNPAKVEMPATNGLAVSAVFVDNRTAVSAPEIITTPTNTDKVPKGESVKVRLNKTDESAALYYSVDGAPDKAYNGEFFVSSAKDTLVIKAIARKTGFKDGVTTRQVVFDNNKITLTFDLPLGVKATNPTGGDVVSATVAGGSFEFKLTVDQSYYTNLDSMVVAANDSTIKAGASGIYTLTNCPSDVTVTVSGLKAKTSTVTLQQTENGKISFTDGAEETTTTVDYGATVSITAVADEDFKFLQWNTGSQSNPLKLTVTKDTTISARFISDYKAYAITLPQLEGVTVKPFSGFTTEVKKDGTFKFYLQFANGYHEDNLVVRANGEELTKNKGGYAIYHINKNISISVEGIGRDAMTLKVPEHVTAKVVETMADVTKQDVYGETVVLLHAEAPAGKVFTKWTDGKTDNPRLSTALDAAQLIPLFDDKGDESYAKVILNQTAGAGITGVNANLDAVKSGDVIQLKVVLLPAYSQSEVVLTADDQKLSPEVSLRAATDTKTYVYKLPVQKDGLAVKVSGLKLNTYDVTMAQTDGGTVSVLPIGKVTHGDKIQLKAQPASGMLFVKWWDGNTLNPYPYTVTSDTEVKAYFLGAESTVDNESIQKEEKAQITVSGQTLSVTVAEESMLYIWDYKGSLFRNQKIPAGAYTLNLPAGGYLVKVGDMGTRKIIIR